MKQAVTEEKTSSTTYYVVVVVEMAGTDRVRIIHSLLSYGGVCNLVSFFSRAAPSFQEARFEPRSLREAVTFFGG